MTRIRSGALTAITPREADLAESYNATLRGDPASAERSHAILTQAHTDRDLLFQDRMLCSVLRPRLLTRERLDRLVEVSECLAALFERCGPALLRSHEHLQIIGASEQELEIWDTDPGYQGFTLTSRLDAFMPGEQPRFVEYNAESPAGIGYCDALSDVFEELPAFIEWASGREYERFSCRRRLLDTLLSAYRQWGGSDTPSIAIIDWDHVITRRDFELCSEYFSEHGVSVSITDPRRLTYRNGRLWNGSDAVTMVYRRVLLHELLEHSAEATGLLRAYRDGAVCMVNSPRSKLLHKKGLFALVSEDRLPVELSAREREIVDEVIPWTRLVEARRTTWHDQPVDLIPTVLEYRERLVLKPVDEYGGRGVVLGWDVDQETWQQAVENATGSRFVVQERVPVPESEFPLWRGDHLELAAMMVDTDPLLFAGRVGGVLTRISGSAVLNVSAGSGSTTPTFIVQET